MELAGRALSTRNHLHHHHALQDQQLPPGVAAAQGGQALHVGEVGVQHAGLYKCTAENGLGMAAETTILLAVLGKNLLLSSYPWFMVARSRVCK